MGFWGGGPGLNLTVRMQKGKGASDCRLGERGGGMDEGEDLELDNWKTCGKRRGGMEGSSKLTGQNPFTRQGEIA